MGSSSSLSVGLLNALYTIKGIKKKPNELAELACKIEIDILKQPIGKQDQYLSAYGGFGNFEFLKNEKVKIKKFNKKKIINKIFDNSTLVWTKQYRKAQSILKNQKKNIIKNFSKLKLMNDISKDLSILNSNKFKIVDFANLLNKNWMIKKGLSKKISSNTNDKFYKLCIKNGALGGKILGAGGGGFFFFIFNKWKKNNFFNFLNKKYYFIKCLPSSKGSKVIYKNTF